MLPPSDLFPGWRIDPDVPHSERFWDGRQWTDKLRPAPRPAGDAREGPRSRGEIGTPDGITIVVTPAVAPSTATANLAALRTAPIPTPIPRLELATLPPPVADTLAEPAVLKPVPSPTPVPAPAPVSIFAATTASGRENSGGCFQVARRVQLPTSGAVSRSPARRVTWSRTVLIGAICLAIGALVGFGAGYQLGSDDATGGVAPSAIE